ncbi:MAG: hypothetical protein AAB529_01835 [Patescibacteria group bacterium]
MTKLKNQQGQILIQVIIFASIAILFIGGAINVVNMGIKSSQQGFNRELAIQIAEAGIDYYRWHLAHAPQDYQDGTEIPGPYSHDFNDKDGNTIGQFILNITPPSIGSSIVVVKSTGKIIADQNISRSIEIRLAKPSFAKYAVVANSAIRFGEGTEVFGPIQSNGGIRFDGLAHNIISSALVSYDDPDHSGANEFGVHTHVFPADPLPPNSAPSRPDVFIAGRQFPVPATDFAGITADLAQIKNDAQAAGFYLSGSGALGYHVVLKTDDTFDLYRITTFINPPRNCSNPGWPTQQGWSIWSILRQQLINNYPLPANGLIFLEDNIFVSGQINTARVTIAAASFPDSPSSRKNIIINNDIQYTNYDGQDVVALIAQGNINIGMTSENDLRVDAALIAQNGRVGRYYYSSNCSPYHIRQTITLYGMIGTNQRYGFAYTDGTGYQVRQFNYDGNFLYNPPPSFPLTSDQYTILSWEEIK